MHIFYNRKLSLAEVEPQGEELGRVSGDSGARKKRKARNIPLSYARYARPKKEVPQNARSRSTDLSGDSGGVLRSSIKRDTGKQNRKDVGILEADSKKKKRGRPKKFYYVSQPIEEHGMRATQNMIYEGKAIDYIREKEGTVTKSLKRISGVKWYDMKKGAGILEQIGRLLSQDNADAETVDAFIMLALQRLDAGEKQKDIVKELREIRKGLKSNVDYARILAHSKLYEAVNAEGTPREE